MSSSFTERLLHKDEEPYLRPTTEGTVAILLSIFVAFFALGGDTSAEIATRVSWIVGVGLFISVLADWRVGLRNLIRVDLMALAALYFLTFFEFIASEQQEFSFTVSVFEAQHGLRASLVGFAAIALGRHFVRPGHGDLPFTKAPRISPRFLFFILCSSFFLANIYMWIAVDFNPRAWFDGLVGARFSQPWARGRLGNITSLLTELQLFGYIVPPLAGLIFSKFREYSITQLAITLLLLLTMLFIGFASGTRNIFGVQLAGLLGGFIIARQHLKLRTIISSALVIALVFVVASEHMLTFRGIGLGKYVQFGYHKEVGLSIFGKNVAEVSDDPFVSEDENEAYFVDLNLRNISKLTVLFPEQYPYLGFNLPWVALTLPVPRAFWPGKPEGLRVSIEEAIGVKGLTLSTTWVGEAYITWGIPGVIIFGCGLGMFFSYWNRLGSRTDSVYALLVYAVGIFAAVITMRSVMTMTTALLPPLALIVFARLLRERLHSDS